MDISKLISELEQARSYLSMANINHEKYYREVTFEEMESICEYMRGMGVDIPLSVDKIEVFGIKIVTERYLVGSYLGKKISSIINTK